jgi:hypothetical protein
MLRDELLDRELLDTLWEVQVLVKRWRHTYNRVRPHSALGYRPPAPETIVAQLTQNPAPSNVSMRYAWIPVNRMVPLISATMEMKQDTATNRSRLRLDGSMKETEPCTSL